jgi:hypothetical protein
MQDQFLLIDPPSPFDSLKAWRCHLRTLRTLPDDAMFKSDMIQDAERMIEEGLLPD